jgi:chemotaxis methyl-accepting protein methylase
MVVRRQIQMHQVQLQLSNKVYNKVKRRADEAGFDSVDEYVADIITSDAEDEDENLDHLFTPERLAHIDQVYAELKAGGKTYTMEEVSAYIAVKRAAWIQENEQ